MSKVYRKLDFAFQRRDGIFRHANMDPCIVSSNRIRLVPNTNRESALQDQKDKKHRCSSE